MKMGHTLLCVLSLFLLKTLVYGNAEESGAKATLTADSTVIPAGGSVTLTCSVDESGVKLYEWFRKTSTTEKQVLNPTVDNTLSVSEGGIYNCRGQRTGTNSVTAESDSVSINQTVPDKATVTLQPNWFLIYSGETITVRCQIQGGGDTEWTYQWRTPQSTTDWTHNNFRSFTGYESSSGDYRCRGRKDYLLTKWSDVITLTVSHKPRSNITVSPSWLGPGASVTLNCQVEHPSAGWRFYWYKAVPRPSDRPYSYELLPGNSSGTEQGSYMVHGQTHTAGYVCRAGRGDPVFYTDYSHRRFVWSGDSHPAASLTVSPDQGQHFTSDSVSLSCGGNSTDWRVMRFTEDVYLSNCSYWGRTTGSTCNITSWSSTAVYWCESGSGEFSNAVNITVHGADILLVSPVRPVTEGDSVTLGCKSRTGKPLSDVFFYLNDKLIQNDSRVELNISVVSKSDEGFYKCQCSGEESPQSWMAVKVMSGHEISSLLVPLIVGLVCGIILIVLLVLLCRYTQSKDSCSIRPIQSESTGRGSTTNHGVDPNKTQRNEYAALLQGDACLYESIKESEDAQNDAGRSQDVTYSVIELKKVGKKEKHRKPDEMCVYSEVKTGAAASVLDDDPMYAEVSRSHLKGKAKRNKGKSSAAAADECFYSEVKPGAASGL